MTPEEKKEIMEEYGITQGLLDSIDRTVHDFFKEQLWIFLIGYFCFFIITNPGVQLFWLTWNIGRYYKKKIQYKNEICENIRIKKEERDRKRLEQNEG